MGEEETTKESGVETEHVFFPWNKAERRPETFGNHDGVPAVVLVKGTGSGLESLFKSTPIEGLDGSRDSEHPLLDPFTEFVSFLSNLERPSNASRDTRMIYHSLSLMLFSRTFTDVGRGGAWDMDQTGRPYSHSHIRNLDQLERNERGLFTDLYLLLRV